MSYPRGQYDVIYTDTCTVKFNSIQSLMHKHTPFFQKYT